MTSISQKEAAKRFAEYWNGKDCEKRYVKQKIVLTDIYTKVSPEKSVKVDGRRAGQVSPGAFRRGYDSSFREV